MPAGASASEVKAGGAFIEIGGRTKNLDKALSLAKKKLTNFGTSVTKLGTSFSKLGAVMAIPLAAGVKVAADFGEQMAFVSTMVQESDMTRFMPNFRSEIRKMSVDFGEGTDTISRGLYDILSASIPPAKALGVLRESMKAAKAGMTDTATAADAITTILNSYKLSADQAGSVSDLLFATVKRGKTTFEELAPAVGMVAATASVAGLSMEEMAATLATGTRNGVRTRISVTALNSTLMAFLKPTENAAKAAKSFGFELNTNTLRTIGLIGVIRKMQGATAEQIASVFENRRALKLIMPVIQDLEGFTIDLNLAQNRAGLTQEAYAKTTITLMHTMKRLKQSMVDLLRTIGISMEKRTKAWMESIIELVNAIKTWIKQNPELVASYANLAIRLVALGASLMVVGKGVTMIAKLLSPGGLFAIGIGSILYFSGLLDENTKKWLDWVGKIKVGATTVKDLFSDIKKLWKDLRPEWESGMEVLRSSWDEFTAAMKVGWLKMSQTLLQSVITTLDAIAKALFKKADELAGDESLLDPFLDPTPGKGKKGILGIIAGRFAAKEAEDYGVVMTEASRIASEAHSKMKDKILAAEAELRSATEKRIEKEKEFEKQMVIGKEKVKGVIDELKKKIKPPKVEIPETSLEMMARLEREALLAGETPEEMLVRIGKGKGGEAKALAAAVPTGEIIGTFRGAIAALKVGGARKVEAEQLDVLQNIEGFVKKTSEEIGGVGALV